MREQRDRFRNKLASDLQKAAHASAHSSMYADERWEVVAERIELMIDAAILESEKRLGQGKEVSR